PRRLAGLDVAEPAAARARVAEDHERCGAALPALADVRAGRLLADRVQVLGLDARAQLAVARASGRRDLEPARLAIADREDLGAEALDPVHAAGFGPRPSAVLAGVPGSARYTPTPRPPRRHPAPAADRPPLHPVPGQAQARDARLRAPSLRDRQLPAQ